MTPCSKLWSDILYCRLDWGYFVLVSMAENCKKRICFAGFSVFNKIRKVLPKTGLRYPLLFSGQAVHVPVGPLLLRVSVHWSQNKSGTLECLVRTIKGELWIENIDVRTRTHCERKIRKLGAITFYIKINHKGKIRKKKIAIHIE